MILPIQYNKTIHKELGKVVFYKVKFLENFGIFKKDDSFKELIYLYIEGKLIYIDDKKVKIQKIKMCINE